MKPDGHRGRHASLTMSSLMIVWAGRQDVIGEGAGDVRHAGARHSCSPPVEAKTRPICS